MYGLQEALEESQDKLKASEAERSSLCRTQEYLEGKVVVLRRELDEVCPYKGLDDMKNIRLLCSQYVAVALALVEVVASSSFFLTAFGCLS